MAWNLGPGDRGKAACVAAAAGNTAAGRKTAGTVVGPATSVAAAG